MPFGTQEILAIVVGASFAAGLNVYATVATLGLLARFGVLPLPPSLHLLTNDWTIGAAALLFAVEFVADKIPLIDHLWNAVHTFVRPIAGAVVAVVASSHALPVTHITAVTSHSGSGAAVVALSTIPITGVGLLVILIIGGLLAALSHTTKATARLVSTITTAGFLNIVLSLVEDVLVLIVILLSLFASTTMLILLALFVLVLAPRYMRTRTIWISRHWRI